MCGHGNSRIVSGLDMSNPSLADLRAFAVSRSLFPPTSLERALVKLGFEPAPLLLGFVLGRLMEENLRRALIIARGQLTTFLERPISAGLLAVALILLVIAFLPAVQKEREEIFVE